VTCATLTLAPPGRAPARAPTRDPATVDQHVIDRRALTDVVYRPVWRCEFVDGVPAWSVHFETDVVELHVVRAAPLDGVGRGIRPRARVVKELVTGGPGPKGHNGRMPTVEGPLIPVSKLIHAPLVDRSGDKLGRIDDLVVRLADGGYPPVTGLQARIGGRQLFVPADNVAKLEPGRVQLSGTTVNLGRFERRPGEVLLRSDVLARKLIDVANGRLVNANDIELGCVDGWWRVVGVDPSRRTMLRRLLPGQASERVDPGRVIDWSDIEPFVGHVPTARLLLPLRRLRRLHPAQIADLVEGASHEEGDEIITAVHADPELEADVFEELDTEHQVEFVRSRSDAEAAAVLAEMGADDAADLITELDQDRRLPILGLLPAEQQKKVRSLLAYNPTTAGGMMSPELIIVPDTASVADALAKLRAADADLPWQVLSAVFITDVDGRFKGSVPVVDLVRAGPEVRVVDAREPVTARLDASDDLPDVALLMTDFNLVAAPVVDDDDRVLGVVTVDDLLEAMMPNDWRRRQAAESES
jgi:CBS domain-containing protein